MNYSVFNSDLEAKKIIESNIEVRHKITSYFGDSAYSSGKLNREFLAHRIFNDEKARMKINEIVHPVVRLAFQEFSNKNTDSIVFNEAAILFETGQYSNFDKILSIRSIN